MTKVGKHSRIKFLILPTKRQKTLALKVCPTGEVEIRAPKFLCQAEVRRFVDQRMNWILEKQKYFSDLLNKYPAKEFKNGETFPVLGRNYRLKVEHHAGAHRPICRRECRRLLVVMNGQQGDELQDGLKDAVREFYSALTRKRVEAFVRKHASALAVRPSRLNVVNQARRWASCSKSGGIRCNWRLAMMPMPVLEYVVVHELCHLKTHDHSPRFWRIIKSVLPDYEKRRYWLKLNGGPLEGMFGA